VVEDDIHASRKRVVRLMQEEGLRARARKRFKSTTMSDHAQSVAANLLNRQFVAPAPNQRSVGDTERHEARSNRVVMKGHHRRLVAASRTKLRAA
jgi:transposase InsO family protein